MTQFVVDASVAAKWFLPEQHAAEARSLLVSTHDLMAPDLIHSEFTNILLKLVRRAELSILQACIAISRMPTLVRVSSVEPLMRSTLELAVRYDRSAYDASYVALALRSSCQLVTADRKLFNALAHALPQTMLWIGDVAAE